KVAPRIRQHAGARLPPMLPRSVIPVTAVAVLVLSSSASAAGEGRSAPPLTLEAAWAVAVAIILPFRARIASAWTSGRRRLAPTPQGRGSAGPPPDALDPRAG